MIKALKLLVPFAIVSAAIALALYAHPRAYQVFIPEPPTADAIPKSAPLTLSGTIRGTIRWNGPLPKVPLIEGGMAKLGEGPTWQAIPNPVAPKIDPVALGIADAVVSLNRVGAERKPWPYPPVSIRMVDGKIALFQGETESRIGLVPLGGDVRIVSNEPGYQMLRARGAAFFTLPLPRPNEPVQRTFSNAGHVDLTSAVGYVWSGADLFVCDHPYFTTTDTEGKFELKDVPPGEYEIMVWLKNWNILGRDRDPETGKILRLHYEKPFTKFHKCAVADGQTSILELKLP